MTRVIVVGVGQKTFRFGSLDEFVPPIEAMRQVVTLAAEDAGSLRLMRDADAVHVVNHLSWRFRDAPSSLAEAISATPAIKEYTAIGGNTPQWLVNRIADHFASGRSRIAIVAGCEMLGSIRRSAKEGRDLGAFSETVEVTPVGIQKNGTLDVEIAHNADLPVRVYPLLENALRAKEGLTIDEQRQWLGWFGEQCSQVASRNEHAWHRQVRDASEVATAAPGNRMLGFPYTRPLNAEIYVDQAASLILTTPEVARQYGIPESQWVYVHGGQDAHDLWFVSERPDLGDSPALRACVEDSLAQADLRLDQIGFFDLYSCFPVMPRLTQHVLGIPRTDRRPITLTGGLPFFGGPGNNYVTHSIAEAVSRCRRHPAEYGMVTSNGYYATKHGVGIYGATPPNGEWNRTPPDRFQAELNLPKPLEIELRPSGSFHVDAYTVWHDRDGEPEYSILCGRTEQGKRAWARTPDGDRDVLAEMMRREWVGKTGEVVGRVGAANIVEFG